MQMNSQALSPMLVFETLNAHHRTGILKAGIDLDVFTGIDEGARTAKELASRSKTSERGMRILCDSLGAMGFLTKQKEQYALTPDSAAFLSRRSPAYMGTAASFLTNEMLMEGFQNVTDAVRKGGTLMADEGSITPDNPVWVEFARSMMSIVAYPAEAIAQLINADSGQPWKVLDIAAGHGIFGITIAKHNRNATIYALDWPNVLNVAQENAEKSGVAERFHKLPGSAFQVEYGSGYDLVMLTNFLHHFDEEGCAQIIRKVHAALKPGGRAITFEFVPNDDRITPPPAALFSMIMLVTTPSGDAYTFSQYEKMFKNAGFSSSSTHSIPNMFQQIIVSQK